MKRLLTSCFGLGLMPIAPGTWGSVLPVLVYMLIAYLVPSPLVCGVVLAVSGLLFCWACVAFSESIVERLGKKDPGEVVADEYAGQAVTLLFALAINPSFEFICVTAGFSFLLFRIFDILKPWPVCALEKLPKGWGILADDLFAGVYAGLVFVVLWKLGWVEAVSNWFFVASALTVNAAAILGTVQGLTEFLPVSSSGHLVFFEKLIPDLEPESQEMLVFDLAIHVGTVGAIFVAYGKNLIKLFADFFQCFKYGKNPVEIYKKSPSVHFFTCVIVTTIVTVILYALFKDPLESARRLAVVVPMWVITGVLLFVTDMRKQTRMGMREFGLLCAVVVGVAQAFAILPGISRSGSTICIAILLGLHREWAVEYSFIIAIPAILGGAVIKAVENLDAIGGDIISIPALMVGMICSFVVGYLSIKLLIATSKRRRLKWFAVYCWSIAAVVFLLYLR